MQNNNNNNKGKKKKKKKAVCVFTLWDPIFGLGMMPQTGTFTPEFRLDSLSVIQANLKVGFPIVPKK